MHVFGFLFLFPKKEIFEGKLPHPLELWSLFSPYRHTQRSVRTSQNQKSIRPSVRARMLLNAKISALMSAPIVSLSRAGRNDAGHRRKRLPADDDAALNQKKGPHSATLEHAKKKKHATSTSLLFLPDANLTSDGGGENGVTLTGKDGDLQGRSSAYHPGNRAEMCSSPRLHPELEAQRVAAYAAQREVCFQAIADNVDKAPIFDLDGVSVDLLEEMPWKKSPPRGGVVATAADVGASPFPEEGNPSSQQPPAVAKRSGDDISEEVKQGNLAALLAKMDADRNRHLAAVKPSAAFLDTSPRWRENADSKNLPPIGHYHPKYKSTNRRGSAGGFIAPKPESISILSPSHPKHQKGGGSGAGGSPLVPHPPKGSPSQATIAGGGGAAGAATSDSTSGQSPQEFNTTVAGGTTAPPPLDANALQQDASPSGPSRAGAVSPTTMSSAAAQKLVPSRAFASRSPRLAAPPKSSRTAADDYIWPLGNDTASFPHTARGGAIPMARQVGREAEPVGAIPLTGRGPAPYYNPREDPRNGFSTKHISDFSKLSPLPNAAAQKLQKEAGDSSRTMRPLDLSTLEKIKFPTSPVMSWAKAGTARGSPLRTSSTRPDPGPMSLSEEADPGSAIDRFHFHTAPVPNIGRGAARPQPAQALDLIYDVTDDLVTPRKRAAIVRADAKGHGDLFRKSETDGCSHYDIAPAMAFVGPKTVREIPFHMSPGRKDDKPLLHDLDHVDGRASPLITRRIVGDPMLQHQVSRALRDKVRSPIRHAPDVVYNVIEQHEKVLPRTDMGHHEMTKQVDRQHVFRGRGLPPVAVVEAQLRADGKRQGAPPTTKASKTQRASAAAGR